MIISVVVAVFISNFLTEFIFKALFISSMNEGKNTHTSIAHKCTNFHIHTYAYINIESASE